MEQLPEAVFLESLNGDILDVNKEACEFLGYSKEELLEMGVEDLVPEDAPAFLPDEIDSATISGEPLETVNLRKDGTRIPVELRMKIVELNGNKRILTTVKDIGDRKEKEKRVKSLAMGWQETFNAMEDLLFLVEEDHTITRVNQAFLDLLDISEDEVVGKKCFDIIHQLDKPIDICPLEKSLETKKSHSVEKYDTVLDKYVMAKTQPIKTADESKVRFVHQIQDITQRVTTQQALELERERLKKLHSAVDLFQSCKTEEELYETTLEVTKNVLGFDVSLIFVARDDRLVPVASNRLDISSLPTYETDEALAGRAYTKGKTVWGQDMRKMAEVKPEDPQLKSFMSVPLGDLGVFQAASKEKGSFCKSDVELAEILAGHLNEEIKRIRLENELKEQAIRDPLTELYNRRYFNESLSKEVGRSERYGHSIAFIMVDINRFKKINDTYSHQKGDEVLKEIASLLRENIREADTVVRYGGDEFLIMMPETNGSSKYILNRLGKNLSEWNEQSDLLDCPLTMAMGISHWNPDQCRSVEDALKEVDRNMYSSKER
jgi:diguanylate cyclase (GGDEF)-like protein/PAS domain S-box-containing protein